MRKALILLSTVFTLFSCTEYQKQDIIVIGGGLMGSASAWHLAMAGKNVLLIEKQDSLYSSGSSLGQARIARSLGSEGDIFSYLHNMTVEEAKKLVAYLNEGLEVKQHSMDDIYATSPVSYVRHIRQTARIDNILRNQRDSFALASSPVAAKELFDATLPDTAIYLREYKKYSGTINPEALIKKLHLAILKTGSKILYNTEVVSLKRQNKLYRLTLLNRHTGSAKDITTKLLVSAAGPYTGELLKDVAPYFKELVNPQRVFLAFHKISDHSYQNLTQTERSRIVDGYPVINSTAGTRQGSFFSMIEKFDEDGIPIIKTGGHFQREEIENLDNVWAKNISSEEEDWARKNTAKYLKTLSLPVGENELIFHSGYSCVYSLTESEVPLVIHALGPDNKPDSSIVVLAGMSGVGAKGSLMYGLLGANKLLGVHSPAELYQKTESALGFERLQADLERKD